MTDRSDTITRCADCNAMIVATDNPDVWIDALREPHCCAWLNESESGVEYHHPI